MKNMWQFVVGVAIGLTSAIGTKVVEIVVKKL